MEQEERKKPGPKPKSDTQPNLKALFDSGLKSQSVKFHSSVDNADGSPENQFSELSDNRSRRAEISVTANGVVIFKQKNAQGREIYFWTATANCVGGKFKD